MSYSGGYDEALKNLRNDLVDGLAQNKVRVRVTGETFVHGSTPPSLPQIKTKFYQNRNMNTTFLHTADWQLGKPFAGIEDMQKRSLVRQERIAVLGRIAETAREHQVQ